MKLCKDCKNFRLPLHMSPYGPWCVSDRLPLDPVYGKTKVEAREVRAPGNQCAPIARWFEPKPVTWFKRIFGS